MRGFPQALTFKPLHGPSQTIPPVGHALCLWLLAPAALSPVIQKVSSKVLQTFIPLRLKLSLPAGQAQTQTGSLVDDVVEVSDGDAIISARRSNTENDLLVGINSVANVWVAQIARMTGNVATVYPTGWDASFQHLAVVNQLQLPRTCVIV